MTETTNVVVVGGGYAGVMAADRLAGHGTAHGVQVTLVDPGAQFTERIRLHQVGADARPSAGVDWTDVLHPAVRRVQARALRIDAEERLVLLEDEEPLRFDRLVLAPGSGAATTPLLSVNDPASAEVTRNRLAALAPGASVTVAGAGPTGTEVACALAAARPDLRVTVVAPSPLAHPVTGHPAVARRLAELGVAVADGSVDPQTGALTSADGRVRPAASATIWTVGLRVPSLATDSGLPVAADGRLLVDATLTVLGHERIVGAGDAVEVTDAVGAHLRASCASALPLGAHAAQTVLARLAGTAPSPLDVGYLVQCLDLGAGRGHVQVVRPDDSARPWALTGRPGGWAKEKVCRMTVSWLAKEARKPGSYTWPSGPAAPAVREDLPA